MIYVRYVVWGYGMGIWYGDMVWGYGMGYDGMVVVGGGGGGGVLGIFNIT